ncbi:MAG: UPF0182 family protein [Methylococcaceae bacterium]|jgi:hypothetical protein
MRNWKLLPALIGTTVLALIVGYIALNFIFIDLFVDLWWFRSLSFDNYFWLRLLYRFFFSGGVTISFFLIFFLHFWIASRYLGINTAEELTLDSAKRRRIQRISESFKNGSIKFFTPIALILAVVIAIPFYQQWETAILYFFGRSSGVVDPVYGNDVSFYMLTLPIYKLIQKELLTTAGLLFLLVSFLYWAEHTFLPNQRQEYSRGAKVHLTVLIGFILFFVIWGFLLDRFSLLHIDTHEPVFFGPGFIDLRYQLPLIWLGIASFLSMSIFGIAYIFNHGKTSAKLAQISFVFFLASIGLRELRLIPEMLNKFYVEPNPVKTESKFMEYNIDATLNAYDLKKIHIVDYPITLNPVTDIQQWGNQKHFENIPVWDREFLNDGYHQLQGIRPYYTFPNVDEDRYFINGHLQQVNLAAREINIDKLPAEAQNWENKYLRFTHGYGAVMTPAAQDAGKPIIWYLRDLNLHSDIGLTVNHPDIYYGLENFGYAITPNKLKVVGIAASDPSNGTLYEGEGGIPLSSLLRKALFAFYFHEEKIFFSSNITNDSKILIRRNIVDRINILTPFLHLDKDPYLVLTNDRFYWIQDAYTLSNEYPVSQYSAERFQDGIQKFNYIRNSVKIVVDAYNGTTHFYISDPSDPLIQAYALAYPNVFENLEQMPEPLQNHLRYPRDMYYLQMKVYAKYHQDTPELFYEQAETWEFASESKKEVKPYYMTIDFGHCQDREEFVLINPMTPISRDNLSMLGLAGVVDDQTCATKYQPNITIFKFKKDVQVNGPAQVDALIDQDPKISEQFSLWDQGGSRVLRGRMIVLPMISSMLYVQPIYLVSTTTRIPELTRVIVSIGNRVVMDTSIREAFTHLQNLFLQNESTFESKTSPEQPPQP